MEAPLNRTELAMYNVSAQWDMGTPHHSVTYTPTTMYVEYGGSMGCTQVNLYTQEGVRAYRSEGYKEGTCPGKGYTRYGGCRQAGGCSSGSWWMQ